MWMVVSLVGVSQAAPAPLLNQQTEQQCSGPETHDLALIARNSGDGANPCPQKWTASEPRLLTWSGAVGSQAVQESAASRAQGQIARARACSSARGPPA